MIKYYVTLIENHGKVELKIYEEQSSPIPRSWIVSLSKNQLLNLLNDAATIVNRIYHE